MSYFHSADMEDSCYPIHATVQSGLTHTITTPPPPSYSLLPPTPAIEAPTSQKWIPASLTGCTNAQSLTDKPPFDMGPLAQGHERGGYAGFTVVKVPFSPVVPSERTVMFDERGEMIYLVEEVETDDVGSRHDPIEMRMGAGVGMNAGMTAEEEAGLSDGASAIRNAMGLVPATLPNDSDTDTDADSLDTSNNSNTSGPEHGQRASLPASSTRPTSRKVEERNSYDGTIPLYPYHPTGWAIRSRLPGPGVH